jgi:hypothetical protein
VRARFYDTRRGTYESIPGSPFGNDRLHAFAWPGERVLVLDAER